MKKILTTLSLSPIALAVVLSSSTAMISTTAQAEFSANIGVHSMYLLRGIAQENKSASVQGGLDYSQSDFYAGWWFASLDYTNSTKATPGRGFENDIYAGYAKDFGLVGIDVGLTQYAYINVDDSNLTEFNLSATVGDFYAKMQYLLKDGIWGNAGDIYWTAGYSFALPKDLSLALDVGYYTYNDDKTKWITSTTEDTAFRNFNVTLSYPIAKTGAEAYIQYTVAGKDRVGVEYEDQMVAGVTYSF